MKYKIIRYLAALNASAFQSAVHSVKAYLAVAAVHAAQDNIPALEWQQALAVFGVSFAIELVNYLDANPLAALIPPEEPPAPAPPTAGGAK